MRSFWLDPYLWIHLSGLAVVPLMLELCFLGLAVGDPVLPAGLEWFLVGAAGTLPILWMQWQRPFSIFSLLVVALKPDSLTDQERRLLKLFKSSESRALAVVVALVLLAILWQLYFAAPLASNVALMLPQWRGLGLVIAAIAFLGCNLFLQVPVSVMRVLSASEVQVEAMQPYPTEQITQDFTLLGWRVEKILPPILPEPPKTAPAPAPVTAPTSSTPAPPTISPAPQDDTDFTTGDFWDEESAPSEVQPSEPDAVAVTEPVSEATEQASESEEQTEAIASTATEVEVNPEVTGAETDTNSDEIALDSAAPDSEEQTNAPAEYPSEESDASSQSKD